MRDWKRYEEAKRLRDTGMTLKETGVALGVSGSRVGAMLRVLARRERRLAMEAETPSLVPWWRGLKYSTWMELKRRGFDSRDACAALAADELTIWRGFVALPGWEEDKGAWSWSKKKLTLTMVNEIRVWLGVAPYVLGPRVASVAELERARRLLVRYGWHVEPPTI